MALWLRAVKSEIRYHQKLTKVCTTPDEFQEWFETSVAAYHAWSISRNCCGIYDKFESLEPVRSYPVMVTIAFGTLHVDVDYLYQDQIMELLGLKGFYLNLQNNQVLGFQTVEPVAPEPEVELIPAIEDRSI